LRWWWFLTEYTQKRFVDLIRDSFNRVDSIRVVVDIC